MAISQINDNIFVFPHPDLSAKGKSTLDQLEETRFEMRQMQSNFAEQESQWREKSSCLEVELINKGQRLKQLEESMNRTERARFELSTKNAELQEKIVGKSNMPQKIGFML